MPSYVSYTDKLEPSASARRDGQLLRTLSHPASVQRAPNTATGEQSDRWELNRDPVSADHKMANSFARRQGDSFVHAGVPLVGNHAVYQAMDNCRPGDEYQEIRKMIFGPNVAIPSLSQVTHEMLQQEAQALRKELEKVETRVREHSPTMNASSTHGTGQDVDDGGAARDDHREAHREAAPEIRQAVDQNDALDSLAPMVDDIIQRLVSFRKRVLRQREIEELEAEAKVLMVAAKEWKAERRGHAGRLQCWWFGLTSFPSGSRALILTPKRIMKTNRHQIKTSTYTERCRTGEGFDCPDPEANELVRRVDNALKEAYKAAEILKKGDAELLALVEKMEAKVRSWQEEDEAAGVKPKSE
ncbi:hypothetical protein CMUS01_15110 [Colletotrichum musicola]|uniref:Uncharacterized protein n=1 Tax=Colletotrichum musicola TaxID=2175873 RepID=A0A8H6IZJ3_9PEZI|nr:hypothetical protein CMUS01_15110 [Colletotrichum musicola]